MFSRCCHRSSSVSRIREVKWQWEHKSGFKDYTPAVSERLEGSYQRGNACCRVKSGKKASNAMEMFFADMVQYDPISMRHRSIRRLGPDPFCQRVARHLTMKVRKAYCSCVGDPWITRFEDYNRMKHKVIDGIELEARVEDYYYDSGCCAGTARSFTFHCVSIMMILFMTIWLGIDAAWNDAPSLYSSETIFIAIENILCWYFTMEITIRFFAFKRKRNCFKDGWFVFDLFLCVLMIGETWALPLWEFLDHCSLKSFPCSDRGSEPQTGRGGYAVFRVARILKVVRLGRVLRLMQVFPNLLTQVRTITAALWSVIFTILLLAIMIYVFAITFKQQCSDPEATPKLNAHFKTLSASLWILVLQGILMDGPTDVVLDAWSEAPILAITFMLFITVSSFTILNMLIGIICTQVDAVYRREQNNKWTARLKSILWELWDVYSQDDNVLDEDEFEDLVKNPFLRFVLAEHNVSIDDLIALKRSIYETKDTLVEIGGSSPVRRPGSASADVRRSRRSEGDLRRSEGDGTDTTASAAFDDVYGELSFPPPEKPVLTFDEFISIVLRLRAGNTAQVKDISNLREFMKTDISAKLDPVWERLDRLTESSASSAPTLAGAVSSRGDCLRSAASVDEESESHPVTEITGTSSQLRGGLGVVPAAQPPGSVAEQLAQLQATMDDFTVQQRLCQRELVARQDRLGEQVALMAKELRVVRMATQFSLGIPVNDDS